MWGNFTMKWNEGRNYQILFLPNSFYICLNDLTLKLVDGWMDEKQVKRIFTTIEKRHIKNILQTGLTSCFEGIKQPVYLV